MNVDWQSMLKRHSIFSALNKKEVDYLIQVSDDKEYDKGDVVIREGEYGNSIFLIGLGAVEVVLPWRGEQTLQLTALGKGEIFGELALFEKPSRRSASVIAAERCVVLEIDGGEFLNVARTHPEIVMGVMEKVTSRLRDIGDHVLKENLRDIDERIDSLNTRLDAELRATGATLNATQTVFDQTSRRANEIIESAERSRNRLTSTASIIGTGITALVAVFGYVGFSQFQNVTALTEAVEKKANAIDAIEERLNNDIANVNKKVEEIDEIEQKLTDATTKLKLVDEEIFRFYRKIMLPRFGDELTRDIEEGKKMYQAMVKMQDPRVTDEMFRIIIDRLITNVLQEKTGETEMDEKDEDGYDDVIINMLEEDESDKTPRQEILFYFAILLFYTLTDEQERYQGTLRRFEKSVESYQGLPIRDELEGLDAYEKYIPSLSTDEEDARQKRKRLNQVWRQIP